MKHLFYILLAFGLAPFLSLAQYTMTVEASPAVTAGLTTYRFYVDMQDPTDRMSAVFGNDQASLLLETPAGAFNNGFNSSWNASGINPAFLPAFPDLADDTYATIGLTGPASTSGIPGAADPSIVEDSNQQITPYFLTPGATSLVSTTLTGSSWYVLNTAANGLPDENLQVLILQVTTSGDISGQINYQVFPLGEGSDQLQLSATFVGAGVFSPAGGPGCMNPNACNYDPAATTDDDSCLQNDECGVCGGDGIAEGDCDCDGNQLDECGVCGGNGIPAGDCDCDGNQLDALGVCGGDCNVDDGTCCSDHIVTIELFDLGNDGWSVNPDWGVSDWGGFIFNGDSVEFTIEDGSQLVFDLCLTEGCYTGQIVIDGWGSEASWAAYQNGVLINSGAGEGNQGIPYEADFFFYAGPGDCVNFGCTNPIACNYDDSATLDDGNCNFTNCAGCVDPTACNYDSTATLEDGSCDYTCLGCTDTTATNYNSNATVNDGTCCFEHIVTIELYDAYSDGWSVNPGYGVLDWGGFIFNGDSVEFAIEDGGQLVFDLCLTEGCYTGQIVIDGWGEEASWAAFQNGVLINSGAGEGSQGIPYEADFFFYAGSGECVNYGCTNPLACNYDDSADLDDGTCGDEDECGVCNGPGAIYECGCNDVPSGDCDCYGNQLDTLGVCGGDCTADADMDGICDNVDDCVGAYDACGVCNGEDTSCQGCTDSEACNYDPYAIFTDGSCTYPDNCGICGGNNSCDDCTDFNNNEVCDVAENTGCTYPTALNYSPNATMDDGSCLFSCAGDINGDGDVQLNDLLDLLSAYGTSCGECPDVDGDDICDWADTCIGVEDACGVCDGDGTSCFGCTDATACNYDAEALIEDGTCTYIEAGACDCEGNVLDECGVCGGEGLSGEACDCDGNVEDAIGTCGGDCPLDANADGICDTEQTEGCTYPAACNYNPYATFEDGSCDFFSCVVPGCTDPSACDYDPVATNEDGSCSYPGCIDPLACNFDGDAGCDDGSCTYPGCTDPSACNYDELAGCDDGSCGLPGCTDETACNYDATAPCDDGSCTYPGCIDIEAVNYDDTAACDDGSCIYAGCTYEFACNYNPEATIDDASCEFGTCPGCTDPAACNFNPTVSEDDGSCSYNNCGCTDIWACNFDPSASTDDGSCEFGTCPGCNDPSATNYNPTSTNNDLCDYCTAIDYQGRVYELVEIGGDCWFAENLAAVNYNDGSPITYGIANWADSEFTQEGRVTAYDESSSLASTYGMLYNWHAVNDERGLCPSGWRVPNYSDFQVVVAAFPTLTEIMAPSGFHALLSGRVNFLGGFEGFGNDTRFWQSEQFDLGSNVAPTLDLVAPSLLELHASDQWYHNRGHSVRCVKE